MLDHGLDLEQLARDAIARGADCLGMAGGDGSQALVASIAVECGVPFVCVTAGTRNHFAHDLGLDRNDPPRERPRLPRTRSNGGSTTPPSTIGSSSTTCPWRVRDDRPAGRLSRRQGRDDQDHAAGAVGQHRRAVRSPVHDSGRQRGRRRLRHPGVEQSVRRWNPPSTSDSDAASTRASSASSPSPGPLGRTPQASSRSPPSVTRPYRTATVHRRELRVRRDRGIAFAGVDGEALEMATPMVFQIYPRGLRLLVPEGNLEAGERRHARNVSLRYLVAVATGRS